MKKNLIIAAIVIALLGTSIGAYAWWDSLQQNRSEDLPIGYGVVLEVDSELEDIRALVPAGSFYAAYAEDYTTEYEFVYTLSLEEPLKADMIANLEIDITNFVLGTYTEGFNVATSVVSIDVNGLTETANGSWLLENAFTDSDNEVTITVTLSLADNGTAFASHYDLVAGKTPTFNISFLVVNDSSSTAPLNPLA